MNGYKIVLLKAILCFIGCRKVNGYAPEYVLYQEWDIKMPKLNHSIYVLLVKFLLPHNKYMVHNQMKFLMNS